MMFMIAASIVFLIACALTFITYKKYENNKFMKNVSGPKQNFFLGNLDLFIGLPKYEYLNLIIKLIKTYGPIFKVGAGPLHTVAVITDIKFLEHILSSTKLIDKSFIYSYLHSWIGTGLLTGTGIKWKKRRRMLTPAFHFSILDNFVEVFENVSDIFIEKLEKEVGKKSVDICPLVSLCTLDIICEATMGTTLNAQNDSQSEYVKCVRLMCRIFTDRVTSPINDNLYFITPDYYREKKALKVLHSHTDTIIDNKIKENLKKNHENGIFKEKKKLAFLDLLLESTIDNGQPLSRLDIREEVDTFMFEGHDTTSAAISFTMYSLAANPDVQKRVMEEQKSIFTNLKNAQCTVTQLNEMKYLELVIKESLRLYPPVPLLARQFNEDVEWDGDIYNKNLNILLPLYAIHRNPDFFQDPEKFNPDRFDDLSSRNPYVYAPFSAGPRNCIGQKFAILEMKSVLSKVLRNFELLPASPTHDLQLVPAIVLQSHNGICIAFKKRCEKF